jgi:hypothetical protein
MSDPRLSDCQVELANMFFSLPESAGFLLAGGGALTAQGIAPRPTDDLDFFTSRHAGSVEVAIRRSEQVNPLTAELLDQAFSRDEA